jgi:hypothetical protein
VELQLADPSGYLGPIAGLVMGVQTATPQILLDRWLRKVLHRHLVALSQLVSPKEVGVETLEENLAVFVVVGVLDINQTAVASCCYDPLVFERNSRN